MVIEHQLENQTLFFQAFQYAPIGMVLVAINGSVLKANSTVCSILGLSEEELLLKNVQDLTHPHDFDLDLAFRNQLIEGMRESYQMEKRLFKQEGEIIWVQITVTLVKNKAGEPQFFISQVINITDQKIADNEIQEKKRLLIEREQRYRSVVEQAFDFITMHTPDGTYLYASPSCYEVLGYSPEEMIGKAGYEFLHPEDVPIAIQDYIAILQTDTLSNKIVRLRKKDGSYIWTESTSSSLLDSETGETKEIIVVSRDITERIKKERSLQDNEQRYKSLFDFHPDLIYSMDLEGNYTSINQTFEELMGYTKQEMLENPINFRSVAVPTDLELVERHFNQAAKGFAQRYEASGICRKGIYTTFDVTNVPIFVNQQVIGVYGIASDITYRNELWKRLEESQNLYQLISENAQDIITFATPDGVVRYVSPAIKTLLGYEPDEYVGKIATDFWHPDDVASFIDKSILQKSDIDTFTCQVRHKQGHYVWFETTAKMIRNEDGEIVKVLAMGRDISERKRAEQELKAAKDQLESFIDRNVDPILILNLEGIAVRINQAFEKTYGWTEPEIIGLHVLDLPNIPLELKPDVAHNLARIKSIETIEGFETIRKRKDGVNLTVMISTFTMRRENGHITGWAVILRDITDKKQAEELLIRSEKLSIAGQLAAGIAHEIRNPITAIKGFVQLMKSGIVEKKMYLDIMASEIERIEMILSELLILAKPQIIQTERKDIRMLLAQVTTLLDTQAIINNVQIITEFDPDIPIILCDENQLKQVCINFIKNGIEAMPKGGNLFIQVTSKNENHIILRFIDQGCGIPEHILSKLGEPFYTTKEKGTGLGFMVSKRIIENHHGEIAVFSEENKGTTIEISLPIAH
ncbi:PAS domain S-box protein [Paenibacillus alginolyticus]|uniref:histidine kinase n=1 Tax=Paenibacillus alginolyticus TaxID=59839 RepID=A0ABT4GF28_9BACL|nr:PAS domain S-box protein [Paenibacillus alginolyticus]MCY9694796.1 PAS domain S-box protein [Paenibacillus alginolyticus]MEC0145766.1 PAS domain S-box protein [Paenibacillus alginolyticus]